MRRKLLLYGVFLVIMLCSSLVISVNAASMWDRTYGAGNSWACSMVEAPDGGYAIVGNADYDIRLAKIDAIGNIEWNRTFGGVGGDWASSLVTTPDGGYAIAGMWNCTGFEQYLESYAIAYFGDFWLVKTDENGVIPEYSSVLVLALVLAATAFITVSKKRLQGKTLKTQRGQDATPMNRPKRAQNNPIATATKVNNSTSKEIAATAWRSVNGRR